LQLTALNKGGVLMYSEELVELITKEVMNRLKILLEENNKSKKKL